MIKFIATSLLLATGLVAHAQWPFQNEAQHAGVISRHLDPKMIGGGVVIFDYNNDGHEDLYFTGGIYVDKLFTNKGDGTFEDVSNETGIFEALKGFKTVGAVSGDLDNDGFRDLVITTDIDEPNLILRNRGGATFELLMPFPDDPKYWSSSVVLSDFNKDSYLDIYIFNFVKYNDEPFYKNRSAGIENKFYMNRGNFEFTDISQFSEVNDSGAGLAGTFSDFDNDGDADLFIVNDFGYEFGPNNLLINEFPQNSFSSIDSKSKVRAAIDGMGIAVGDYNKDGLLDYYVSNFLGNLLLTNRGQNFEEGARQKNIEVYNEISWGTFFFDFNNDSNLDLFVANGSMVEPGVLQHNRLFQQNDDGSFNDVTPLDLAVNKNIARGAAFGDLNNDGYQDVVVAKVGIDATAASPALLFINHSEKHNNWFKLKLIGTLSNRDAYDAKIQLFVKENIHLQEIQAGSSYLSQNTSVAHFGLGKTTKIDSLKILWPNGLMEIYKDLEVNQYMEAVEQEGLSKAKVKEADLVMNIADEKRGDLVQIYPNPFNKTIHISIENNDEKLIPEFQLINSLGHQINASIKVEQTSKNDFVVQMEEMLPPDIYILKIRLGLETIHQKIIKQH